MPARPSSATTSSAPPWPEDPLAAAVTAKFTEVGCDDPTVFAHDSVYVLVPAAAGVRFCVPLVAIVPLQLPDPVQLVAFTEDQVMVVELPTVTDVAANVRVGAAGGALTAKVTVLGVDVPMALAQVSE